MKQIFYGALSFDQDDGKSGGTLSGAHESHPLVRLGLDIHPSGENPQNPGNVFRHRRKMGASFGFSRTIVESTLQTG
jgi:hypothetical protein